MCKRKTKYSDNLEVPNRVTRRAMRESKRMEKHPERYKSYSSVDELFEALEK